MNIDNMGPTSPTSSHSPSITLAARLVHLTQENRRVFPEKFQGKKISQESGIRGLPTEKKKRKKERKEKETESPRMKPK